MKKGIICPGCRFKGKKERNIGKLLICPECRAIFLVTKDKRSDSNRKNVEPCYARLTLLRGSRGVIIRVKNISPSGVGFFYKYPLNPKADLSYLFAFLAKTIR